MYLQTNLTKKVKGLSSENYQSNLMKEIREDTNK